jgi:hypothetical protein
VGKEKKSLLDIEDEIGVAINLIKAAFMAISDLPDQAASPLQAVLLIASRNLTEACDDLSAYRSMEAITPSVPFKTKTAA